MNLRTNSLGTSRRPLPAMCLIALMLVLGLMIASPATRSMLNETLYPLGLALSRPTNAVSEHFEEIPLVSLDEAQRQIPFRILLPTWLPEGLMLNGAHVRGAWVNVSYINKLPGKDGGLGIEITQGTGLGTGSYIVPDSAKQEMVINGRPALYVRGAWDQNMQWHDTADVGVLLWESDGLKYRLGYSGLNLSRENLIQVAESLR